MPQKAIYPSVWGNYPAARLRGSSPRDCCWKPGVVQAHAQHGQKPGHSREPGWVFSRAWSAAEIQQGGGLEQGHEDGTWWNTLSEIPCVQGRVSEWPYGAELPARVRPQHCSPIFLLHEISTLTSLVRKIGIWGKSSERKQAVSEHP